MEHGPEGFLTSTMSRNITAYILSAVLHNLMSTSCLRPDSATSASRSTKGLFFYSALPPVAERSTMLCRKVESRTKKIATHPLPFFPSAEEGPNFTHPARALCFVLALVTHFVRFC
jgi:hypothetical protein